MELSLDSRAKEDAQIFRVVFFFLPGCFWAIFISLKHPWHALTLKDAYLGKFRLWEPFWKKTTVVCNSTFRLVENVLMTNVNFQHSLPIE